MTVIGIPITLIHTHMLYSGGLLIGPYSGAVTIQTQGTPTDIQITAEPTQYACGGVYVGCQVLDVSDRSFTIRVDTNTTALLKFRYGTRI